MQSYLQQVSWYSKIMQTDPGNMLAYEDLHGAYNKYGTISGTDIVPCRGKICNNHKYEGWNMYTIP